MVRSTLLIIRYRISIQDIRGKDAQERRPPTVVDLAMPKAVLVTGQPGCGKTVLVRELYERAVRSVGEACCSGFYTDETLSSGSRDGFDLVIVGARAGARGVFARKGMKSAHKTGAYGVDVAAFERLALPEIQLDDAHACGASTMPWPRLVVVDEIGRMEAHSAEFCTSIRRLLEQPHARLIGSVAAPRYGHTLAIAEETKVVPGVVVLHMKPSTREHTRQLAIAAVDEMVGEMLSEMRAARRDCDDRTSAAPRGSKKRKLAGRRAA